MIILEPRCLCNERCGLLDLLFVRVARRNRFFRNAMRCEDDVNGSTGFSVADLTAMDFPVWSKAISAMGTVKATLGSVNVPVVCAGGLIHPGDAVIGDLDGVVVVPREDVVEVVKAAQARIVKEEKNRERLRAGEAGLDMYGLRAKLKDLGVVYVDQED